MKKHNLKIFLIFIISVVFCTVAFAQRISDPLAKKYHNPFKKQIEKIMDMEDKYADARSYSNVSSDTLRQYRAKIDKEKEKLLKKIKALKEKTQKEIETLEKTIKQAEETNNQSRLKSAQRQLEDRKMYLRYIDIWAHNEDPYEADEISRKDLDDLTFSRDGKRRHYNDEEDGDSRGKEKNKKSERKNSKKDKDKNKKKQESTEDKPEKDDSDSESDSNSDSDSEEAYDEEID